VLCIPDDGIVTGLFAYNSTYKTKQQNAREDVRHPVAME